MTTPERGQRVGHSSTHYEDFALTLEADGSDFRVRLLRSPYGGGEARFNLPLAGDEMQELLTELENSVCRCGSTASAQARHLTLVEAETPLSPEGAPNPIALTVGEVLFEALFTGTVRERYLSSLGLVEAQPEAGLRIRLVLDPSRPEIAPLCALPWELLYRPQTRHFLARDVRTPVCRFLNVQQPSRALPIMGPLRILVAMASPTDAQALDLPAERRRIEAAWARTSGVTVDFIEHAGIENVYQKLRDGAYEVLHFMGHGDFDADKGVLLFEDETGWSAPVAGEVLGETLRGIRSLRLVVLNACQSAAFSRRSGQDPYTGVANALVMRGVPSVLAMQFPISDEAAICFSGAFYSALAAGDPVDRAASEGRLAIYRAAPYSFEWATPALFLNVPDGRLFAPSAQNAEARGHADGVNEDFVSVVWADMQPLFIVDFTPPTRLKAARETTPSNSLLTGRRGAWTGVFVEGGYVLINDGKREDIKYFCLSDNMLNLSEAPVSVEVAIESVAREPDLAGAGLLYRCDSRTGCYYAFLLKPGQSFAFYRFDAQGFGLVYSELSTAIRTGELNRLAILGAGHSIHLYINEQRVKTIEEPNPLWGDQVGIVAVSRGRYRFDNFAVFRT